MALNFTDKEKIEILKLKESSGATVANICARYKISIQTYYSWRKEFLNELVPPQETEKEKLPKEDLKQENQQLKRLYINLSQHNYELSKLLIK